MRETGEIRRLICNFILDNYIDRAVNVTLCVTLYMTIYSDFLFSGAEQCL